eukprot:CAMPEP_0203874780 /NCGR_PEP_ID=MMETSP0359-20131031/20463_1 /ASSEMBLY_ACC=CAM_ASM_000338 /TAXON_ID=268821 /ORGANISM="Scrippsiella Hangoei, Strain SHTV-5" /LENGTH=1315 /DNA_ID=CAMNT_0050793553 /DNA_START=36 /DNA_END=3983 /DNA_ORIENTATION=-
MTFFLPKRRDIVFVEEQVPILSDSWTAQPRRRLPSWAGVFGVVALVAIAAVALNYAHPGSAQQVAARPRTQFLAEIVPADGSVVATAKQLSGQVDQIRSQLDANKAQATSLEQQAKDLMANGTFKIASAINETAAAKAEKAEAEEMKKKAEEQIQKASAMLQDSTDATSNATALAERGREGIAEAKQLNSSAQTLDAKAKEEVAQIQGVQTDEIRALIHEAKYLKGKAAADENAAAPVAAAAQAKAQADQTQVDEAAGRLDNATKLLHDAEAAEKKAEADASHAQTLEEQATRTIESATNIKAEVGQALAAGQSEAAQAKEAQKKVDLETAKVTKLERSALKVSAGHRACVDLLGVRMREVTDAADIAPIAVEKDVSNSTMCSAWCKEHEGCVQSTFSGGNKACYLFEKTTTEAQEWGEAYNTSFCGDAKESDHLMDMLNTVYRQKPALPEPVECSWAGNDCSSTKCCNNVACPWDLNGCKPFSCYQQPDGSAKCMETAAWTTGVIIGGGRQLRSVPKAFDGVTVQGTTLFCFMVAMWSKEEGAVANNSKDKKLSIFQCDGSTILAAWEVSKTPWSTYMNADAFVKHWGEVQQSGQFAQYDWTVKVDVDTVFFPNILKMHLANLGTPQGAKVYLKNINYKWQFFGGIEVISREALQLYFARSGECSGISEQLPKAGEDFYMKTCLDGLGVDTMDDFSLLRDQSCGTDCGVVDTSCSDGWVPAYHYFRDADSWNKCHDEALEAQETAGHKAGDIAAMPAATKEAMKVVGGSEADHATNLLSQASALKTSLQPQASAAQASNKSAWNQIDAATAKIHQADKDSAGAKANTTKAQQLEQEAAKRIAAANDVEDAQQKLADTASSKHDEWAQRLADDKEKLDAANAAVQAAVKENGTAMAAEAKLVSEVASRRICLDLPGVRMSTPEGQELGLPAIVVERDVSTPEKCRDWCRGHVDCRQSIFSAEGGSCYFMGARSGQPLSFKDTFNSSFCGEASEFDPMMDMLNGVFKMKPFVPPVRACTWAGENCIDSQCCANVAVPNWKFTEFQWYTCWKKDEFFASCETGPAPGGWDGAVLGHMGTREVPKAPEGVLVQGTSLFCFSVVCWDKGPTEAFWSSEAELANNAKQMGRGITQCDDHAFFTGGALGGGDSSSINNIDAFVGAWNQVHADGRYLKHDWTIKVDADAVFFPNRLRAHLRDLRTPQGSRVYLRNINFKFQFMGALEIFTSEALEHYFKNQDTCTSKVGHQGGEDYYMLSCMDGIGVDHQTDWKLLNDKYAATGNCNDPWVVGFHFYKKVTSWNECWEAAENSAKASGMNFE